MGSSLTFTPLALPCSIRREMYRCGALILAGIAALVLSAESYAEEISFRNDVMAALSKAGCNLGTCHGNARGKGGFQISLRGQDPANDYLVLTRDWLTRRTNPSQPDQSLLLLKPTMQVAHEGGRRLDVGSAEYQILRDWIASGTPDDPANAKRLVDLIVTPREAFLSQNGNEESKGWQIQLSAIAVFSDGTKRDITPRAVYEISNPIAEISREGLVRGLQVGETTVLVRYLHQQIPVRLAFLRDSQGFTWSKLYHANAVLSDMHSTPNSNNERTS